VIVDAARDDAQGVIERPTGVSRDPRGEIGTLEEIVGAPRTVERTVGAIAAPTVGRIPGTNMAAMPSTMPGSSAASKMAAPTPTTATVAAVASNSR
jgi:hypothetical protein